MPIDVAAFEAAAASGDWDSVRAPLLEVLSLDAATGAPSDQVLAYRLKLLASSFIRTAVILDKVNEALESHGLRHASMKEVVSLRAWVKAHLHSLLP